MNIYLNVHKQCNEAYAGNESMIEMSRGRSESNAAHRELFKDEYVWLQLRDVRVVAILLEPDRMRLQDSFFSTQDGWQLP